MIVKSEIHKNRCRVAPFILTNATIRPIHKNRIQNGLLSRILITPINLADRLYHA